VTPHATVAFLALCVACQGPDWVIASERADGGGTNEPPGGPPTNYTIHPECPTARELLAARADLYGSPDLDPRHAGTWSGSLGGSAQGGFPSAQVELSLDASGVGHLTFLEVALPEADDPDSGYLCSVNTDGVACGTASGFVGGFSYPLERVTSRGDVLSFVIVQNDPWGDWCALHPVQRWPDETLECGFGFGVSPLGTDTETSAGCAHVSSDGSTTPLDCALMYALRHCECAADACFSSFESGIDVGLELGANGDSLHGSLWYSGDVDAASIMLQRQRDP
jgi:hypothetical protein